MVDKVTVSNIVNRVSSGETAAAIANDNKRAINEVIDKLDTFADSHEIGTGPDQVPTNSLLGTSSTVDTGTATDEIPKNSDLGSASLVNTGTGAGDVPLNSGLGSASLVDTGTDFDQVPINTNIVYPVDTVADLRLLAGISVGQKFQLDGHTNQGVGGGVLTATKLYTTEIDDNGYLFTVDGVVIERERKSYVTLQEFGGLADYDYDTGTGTDNASIAQIAEDYCRDNKVSLSIDGRFGIGSAITQRAIKVYGSLPGTSGLYALNDSHRILTADALDIGGECLLKDFTIHGYADRNPTQGGNEDALVDISPFDRCVFDNVEGAYGRQMAFKSRATVSVAENCYVHHMHRDGINFTDSKHRTVNNCRIEYIADDAIACHLPAVTTADEFVYSETVITNNQIFNCYGIKALTSTATITGNRGQMVFGYGVFVGFDGTVGFEEGFIDKKLTTISDNNFENIINLAAVGGGNIGAGVWVSSDIQQISGVVPGQPDALGAFTDDLPYMNEFAATAGHLGTKGITISNNNIMQTWTGGTLISDYDLGEAWTTSGFDDIALTGTLGKDGNSVFGYRFDEAMKGINLKCGATYGVESGIRLQDIEEVTDVNIDLGVMSRLSSRAVSVGLSVSSLHCTNTVINGGSLNLDPLHEHSDRNADGSWNNTGDTNGIFFEANNVYGVAVTNVSFRNVKRILQGTTNINPFNNIYYYEPGKGIAAPFDAADQVLMYTDSDPTSASYGEVLQGSLSNVSVVPTSGSYFIGQTIKNSAPGTNQAEFGSKKISEFIRLTNGSSHVVGTDWGAIELVTA